MNHEQPPNDNGGRHRAPEPARIDNANGGRHRAPEPARIDNANGGRRRRSRVPVDRRGISRGITTAAVVVAAITGAGAIGIAAGLLTLFGWGLAIVVAILTVGVATAIRPRPANGWLLVPLLALALPSAAVAISGVRVLPERGRVVETPTTVAQIPDHGYRAGFGDLLVDLRNLVADDGDEIVVTAGSDLGRTVVALPQDRCFNLDIRWRTGNLRLPRVRERPTVTGLRPERPLSRLGRQSPGNRKRFGTTHGRIALFGRAYAIDHGRWVSPSNDQGGPTLTLELASEGGSFVVRDYPDHVSPLHATDWPTDQKPPRPGPGNRREMAAAIKREERAVAADWIHRSRATLPRNGRASGVQITAEAHRRVYTGLQRQSEQRQRAFSREWARRVTGTCNPKGTFR